MKVIVTMSKEEKKLVLDQVLFDPCERVNCADIDCAHCPLHKVANKYRAAMDDFEDALKAIPEGEGE